MKTNTYYRLGIIAICIMTIYEIVLSVIFMISLNEPDTYGNYEWSLLYPASVLAVASIAGLVLYVRKKTLGWILCCGYSIFMLAGTVIGYFAFWRLGISLEETTSDLLIPAIIQGVLFASVVGLFLARQVRSVFFDSGQTGLPDIIPAVIVAAIVIGIIAFIPILANFLKNHYVVIILATLLLALRWFINHNK